MAVWQVSSTLEVRVRDRSLDETYRYIRYCTHLRKLASFIKASDDLGEVTHQEIVRDAVARVGSIISINLKDSHPVEPIRGVSAPTHNEKTWKQS